jgi:general secretion pathway protein G
MNRTCAAPAAGFTLIELLVTVAIVALLASIAVPLAQVSVKRSHEQELRVALREIRGALDAYRQAVQDGRILNQQESGYPPSLQVLVEGVPDAGSPDRKRRIYFLRRIPRDPFAADANLSDAETWGKRSYASPPDDPQEGDDVFDVYSKAAGLGLSGIAYRDW